MMKILVTGAGGQLGSELRRLAAEELAYGDWIFTDVAELDIADRGQVASFFKREQPAVVVNCAAYTDVDGAENEREAAFRINAEGPAELAAAAREYGAVLVHISTDFVFGGCERASRHTEETPESKESSGTPTVPKGVETPPCERKTPYTEEDTPAPLNVYGESKLAGERVVLGSGCRGAVVRTSWLHSPYGRNFVKSIMAAAARNREIRVVSDQWGNPTAADGLASAVAEMIPWLLETEEPAGLFHYCDTGVVSRSSFATEIVRLAGADCRVLPVPSSEYPMTAQRPAYSALDTSKIGRVFGVVPRSWQDALVECMERIKENG